MQKIHHLLILPVACLFASLSVSAQDQAASKQYKAELVQTFTNLSFQKPLRTTIPPDGTHRSFLVEQVGIIRILPEDRTGSETQTFLDITDRPLWARDGDFEEGLLCIAFHPEFKQNRKFYLYYTLQNPKRSVISEWAASESDPNRADMESERILMEIPQPFWNHNSGHMIFGPKDGYLYISVGDGGKGNDPFGNAQNLQTFLGSVLRIDVNTRTRPLRYGIPEDNPFVGWGSRARPEIWAYGLRNPWGIHFDEDTGVLWCADVGQNKYEEIDLIEKGRNYGWNYREGFHAFDLNKNQPPAEAAFVDPLLEYGRLDGISVTGGVVYRGALFPEWKGAFLYGDWFSGKIWAVKQENGKLVSNDLIFQKDILSPMKIGGFSEDANHEVLVFSLDHTIWELRRKSETPASEEAASRPAP